MDDIKKYCGLLMFDTDSRSTTSRNDFTNSSTREVDINALAAGAAADQSNTANTDDVERPDSSKRTPRPPNAFILYRQAKQPALIASQHLTNAQVSRKISEMWKNECEEVRLHWEKMADKKKLEHMNRFPNYVYKPNKNKPKIDKRKEKRKQSLAASSVFSGSNDVPSGTTGPIRPKTKKATRPMPPLSTRASQQNQTIINSTYMPQTNIVSRPQYIISPEMLLPEFYQQQQQMTTPTSALHENGLKIHRVRHQLQQNPIQRVVPEEEEEPSFAHPNSGTAFAPSIDGLATATYSYGTPIQSIDGFVPDVAHSSQQIFSEYLLHQEPSSPTTSSSASNSPITTQSASEEFFQQTYPAGTYADLLVSANYGLDFLDGSVSHHSEYYQ